MFRFSLKPTFKNLREKTKRFVWPKLTSNIRKVTPFNLVSEERERLANWDF